MCDFCIQHGDGKRWYLQAKNYESDLLSDMRRRRLIADAYTRPEHYWRLLDRAGKLPSFVRRAIGNLVTRHLKNAHFGQVLPIEEVARIFGFANSVVRMPCACRHVMDGGEAGNCYGLSIGPDQGYVGILRDLDDSFLNGPDTSGFEELSTADALSALRGLEAEGHCHTVWSYGTPFIGGICNCRMGSCMAMEADRKQIVKVMFRGEWVARIEPDLCVGCRACVDQCQFDALSYDAASAKVRVDETACYGCGICRSACPVDAIALIPRAESDVASDLW